VHAGGDRGPHGVVARGQRETYEVEKYRAGEQEQGARRGAVVGEHDERADSLREAYEHSDHAAPAAGHGTEPMREQEAEFRDHEESVAVGIERKDDVEGVALHEGGVRGDETGRR
jgi:hypothetical protein